MMIGQVLTLLVLGISVLATALLGAGVAATQPAPLALEDFLEVAPQGFGDPMNDGTWSMQWWQGQLYVGTVRGSYCWGAAYLHQAYPGLFKYPPAGPTAHCAPDPTDLGLQAEIWRYTPAISAWTRVYRSPNDVQIPGHPGKFTARDIGFRTMAVFTDPDGTEALYVGGVSSNFLWPPMPPPRILRSSDGRTFTPVPQAEGTLLGAPPNAGAFTSMAVHNRRFYVVNARIRGAGVVLEADAPAAGNDSFRAITPPGMQVFQVVSFNGFLYLGIADQVRGYAIVKTDTTRPPPYRWVPVVSHGGSLPLLPKASVVSMHVHDGRLYVGTTGEAVPRVPNEGVPFVGPTELIRINPDDSWELLVGTPRRTATGIKEPWSGLGAGFDWFFNVHVWRMQGHEGWLYLGTIDEPPQPLLASPWISPLIERRRGFDFYRTEDGAHFVPISTQGLGDPLQVGLRTLASTTDGLFVGGLSYWSGLRVWRGLATARALEPPARLEVEDRPGGRIVSWDPPSGAARVRVYRAATLTEAFVPIPDQPVDPAGDDPRRIAVTPASSIVDRSATPGRVYHYIAVAENAAGARSGPSNVARGPSLASAVTFARVENLLRDWAGTRSDGLIVLLEAAADDLVETGDYAAARRDLEHVLESAEGAPAVLPSWRVADLRVVLTRLARRVDLAEAGLLAVQDLL